MKHDCDIVRDLMPLVVDGTASEKSREMVGEHVAECEPCREMFDEMRQEVPAQPQRQAGELVKKLRWRRRLRGAALVLLGVALSALLAMAGLCGWEYYFKADVVLTAEENYSVELVQDDIYGTQTIWTIKDGHAQISNASFDAKTGDMYFWSSTSRIPLPTKSDKMVNQEFHLCYYEDLGYAYIDVLFDAEGNALYAAVTPVNRIIRGLPEGWESRYTGTPPFQQVIFERSSPSDEALTEAWRARLDETGFFDEWRERMGSRNLEMVPEEAE